MGFHLLLLLVYNFVSHLIQILKNQLNLNYLSAGNQNNLRGHTYKYISSRVLKAEVSQLVSINSHSARQQGVSKIFLAASCILYLGRNYVVPACVLLDTVIGIFRYPTASVSAQNSRSDLEMELKSILALHFT